MIVTHSCLQDLIEELEIEKANIADKTVRWMTSRTPEQKEAVTFEVTLWVTALRKGGDEDMLLEYGDTTGCANAALTQTGWYARGDSVQSRPLVGKRAWMWVVPLVRVAAPSSLILPAHMTWDVLWQMVSTWAEVWDEWSTWADLWGATIAPDTVYDALMGES